MIRSLSRIARLGRLQGLMVFVALAAFEWQIALTGFSQSTRVFDSPEAAYTYAFNKAGENDRIVVFGSFLTVAGVMKARKLKSADSGR